MIVPVIDTFSIALPCEGRATSSIIPGTKAGVRRGSECRAWPHHHIAGGNHVGS
jgi:hypothetical protein